MEFTSQFITKFQNLDGITVAEKRKNFNKLIQENASSLKDCQTSDSIISHLNPKTHLETIFRTELLLFCRHVPELMKILVSGDENLIKKIIKHGWFLQAAFENLTGQQIVDDILPHVSFSIRTKLLRKLVLSLNDEDKLYELFNVFKTKFGMSSALPLLLGCKSEKIEYIIKNNPIFLTEGQLKCLIHNSPKLIPIYVEEYIKHKGDHPDLLMNKKLFHLLALKDSNTYKELKEKYNIGFHYGRRVTCRIFDQYKHEILCDPSKHEAKFEQNAFVRRLGVNGCFKEYFRKAFPESIEHFHFSSVISQLLSKYPKLGQFQLLQDTFEQVYKVRLLDCPTKIDKSMLDIIHDMDVRDKIATKLMEITNDTQYTAFQKPSKSIPHIKNEINLSSKTSQRKTLIKLLVDTCKINNDMNSLKQAIQYVIKRHRNDEYVVCHFLCQIEEQFDLHKFTGELWGPIIELYDIYKLKVPRHYGFSSLLFFYIEFKYNSGDPTDEALMKYLAQDNIGSSMFSHECKNMKFLQKIINDFIVAAPGPDKEMDINFRSLVAGLHEWNTKNPGYAISYLDIPKVRNGLKVMLENNSYPRLWFMFELKHRNEYTNEIIDKLWADYASYADTKHICYHFKWYPHTLLRHKNSVFKAKIHNDTTRLNKILTWVRKYEHLDFPKHVINFCQDDYDKEDKSELDFETVQSFERLFIMLANLMAPNDYVSYVSEHKPKSLTVDMTKEEEKQIYKLQCLIARSFRYVDNRPVILPVIMDYCGGDYLKHVLDALYKSFHHTPQNILPPYFDQLQKKAVSVRKHAVLLTSKIGDLDSIEKILMLVIKNENNKSLKKRYMLITFHCFQQYSTDNFWNKFKTCFDFLDENDTESFELLVSSKEYIPKNYFCMYYEEIWSLIEKKNLNKKLAYGLQNSLIQRIESSVEKFPSQFCYKIIDRLFFKFYDDIPYSGNINNFVSSFLLRHKDPQKFQKIINQLESSKVLSANDPKSEKVTKQQICDFIKNFCHYYFDCGEYKKGDKQFIQIFIRQLLNLYPDVQFFNEYLLLLFTSNLVASSSIEEYAQKVSQCSEEMISRYGLYVLDNIQNVVFASLKFFKKDSECKNKSLKMFHELLKFKDNEINNVLCLKLFLNSDSSMPDYENCLNILKNSTIPYVQISLREHDLI